MGGAQYFPEADVLTIAQFLAKYQPLYDRREAIITGKEEPTEKEVEEGKNADSDDEDEEETEGAQITEVDDDGKEKKDEGADAKGIPEFWLTAMKNSMPLAETITDSDEEALKSLEDIRLSYLDGQAGFQLHFTFAPNDFFEDKELTKTYYYQVSSASAGATPANTKKDQVGYGGDFVYDKAVGSDIKWKEDKDLTKKIEIKKQRNKTSGRTRVVRKSVPTESFFNFFKPPQPPTREELEEGDVDEEELEELDGRLEIDYQLGEDFKEKIIPRAVDYFTGKALRYEDDFEDEFEDDDEDYEDDDDEDGALLGADGQDCKQQ